MVDFFSIDLLVLIEIVVLYPIAHTIFDLPETRKLTCIIIRR